MEMSDITIESIKKATLKDGDLVFVTMPFEKNEPHDVRNKTAVYVREKMQKLLNEAGHEKCRVVIMPSGTSIDVLSKGEIEELLREGE